MLFNLQGRSRWGALIANNTGCIQIRNTLDSLWKFAVLSPKEYLSLLLLPQHLIEPPLLERMEKIGTSDFQPDPDGDLKFILEQPGGENLALLVSSKIMSLASPVFKAMLGPHFKEGKKRMNPDEPREVVLKEDDPEAIKWICWKLHHRHGLDMVIEMGAIHGIAIVIHKYDLAGGLQDQAALVIQKHLNSTARYDTLAELIFCCIMFEDSCSFHDVTHKMVLTTLGLKRGELRQAIERHQYLPEDMLGASLELWTFHMLISTTETIEDQRQHAIWVFKAVLATT